MKRKITNSLKPPLMQTWSAFNMFLVFYVWCLRKNNFFFFSDKFSVKIFRYVPYGYRVVLDSARDAEISKGQSLVSFS